MPAVINSCIIKNPSGGSTLKNNQEYSNMTEGTVKWFNDQKGFGFITTNDGRDLFVHHSNIVSDGFRTLAEGAKVKFEVEQGNKGPCATQVQVI